VSVANVNLRRDHVGGAAFILIGALVLSMSDDLPFGTLASPGAGMMPKLVIAAMLAFGLILLVRARGSPVRTLLMAAVGLLLGCIGIDVMSGHFRYSFASLAFMR